MPVLSTIPELGQRENALFQRLESLFEEQRQIYQQVLELSRQQGELVSRGAPLADIRQVLQKKNVCLEIIRRLELTERSAKQEWEKGRQHWSAAHQARLNQNLHRVGSLIEEILVCEEKNDQQFIEQLGEIS